MNKLLISIILTSVLAGAAVALITFVCEDDWCFIFPWQKRPVELTGVDAPTDFEKEGTIEFEDLGSDRPLDMHLNYQESGQPASKKLILDPLSVCAAQSGATPCLAMSVTLDVPYGGKRVIAEGITQPDGSVLVRKLRRLEEGEPTMISQAGHVFISWPQAQMLLRQCGVSMVLQTHSLNVHLTLKDGREVVAVESMIDEVFEVLQETQPVCGNIPVATE